MEKLNDFLKATVKNVLFIINILKNLEWYCFSQTGNWRQPASASKELMNFCLTLTIKLLSTTPTLKSVPQTYTCFSELFLHLCNKKHSSFQQ